MRTVALLILALTVAACGDQRTDDDVDLGGGPAIQINVQKEEPHPVDTTRYDILDLSQTVSTPVENMPQPVDEKPTVAENHPVVVSQKPRPIESYGAASLKTLGITRSDIEIQPKARPVSTAAQPSGDLYADGYRYARDLGTLDTRYCRERPKSFIAGCMEYMLGMNSQLELATR
jgi:hypothetical protein